MMQAEGSETDSSLSEAGERRRQVAVIGSGSCEQGSELAQLAEEVGRAARRGRCGAGQRRPRRGDGGRVAWRGGSRRDGDRNRPLGLGRARQRSLHPRRRDRDRPRPQPRSGRQRRGRDRGRRRVGDAARRSASPGGSAAASPPCAAGRLAAKGRWSRCPASRWRRRPKPRSRRRSTRSARGRSGKRRAAAAPRPPTPTRRRRRRATGPETSNATGPGSSPSGRSAGSRSSWRLITASTSTEPPRAWTEAAAPRRTRSRGSAREGPRDLGLARQTGEGSRRRSNGPRSWSSSKSDCTTSSSSCSVAVAVAPRERPSAPRRGSAPRPGPRPAPRRRRRRCCRASPRRDCPAGRSSPRVHRLAQQLFEELVLVGGEDQEGLSGLQVGGRRGAEAKRRGLDALDLLLRADQAPQLGGAEPGGAERLAEPCSADSPRPGARRRPRSRSTRSPAWPRQQSGRPRGRRRRSS